MLVTGHFKFFPFLREELKADPSLDYTLEAVCLTYAALQYRTHKFTDAIATCSRLLEVNPTVVVGFIIRGSAFGEVSNQQQAEVDFARVAELLAAEAPVFLPALPFSPDLFATAPPPLDASEAPRRVAARWLEQAQTTARDRQEKKLAVRRMLEAVPMATLGGSQADLMSDWAVNQTPPT